MLASVSGLAQFSFNVTKTDETCTGNATLSFQLTNTNPQASYTFVIYKLPNTTTPLLVTSSTLVEFLAHGTYIIEAIENLSGTTTVQTQQVVIENLVVPLSYYIVESQGDCGIDIEVVTVEGTPVSYEIFSGPTTFPLQESNVFTGLQTGETYQIRIYDDCGEGYVRTHTIVTESDWFFNIWNTHNELIACDTIRAYYGVNSSEAIPNMEIPCVFTFPDGSQTSFTVTKNIVEGMADPAFYIDFPYFNGEPVSFAIEYTDMCGNSQTITKEYMFAQFDVGENECGNVYFTLNVEGLLYPFKVEIESLDGVVFDPLDYNENHPYHSQEHVVYGMMDNPFPWGNYLVTVTDDCGFEQQFEFNVEQIDDEPIKGYGNYGCQEFGGYFLIKFQTDRTIVSAQIIDGPPELEPFPINIDDAINEQGEVRVEGYPEGVYTVLIVDSCGMEQEVEIEIPANSMSDFQGTSFIACEDFHGTLRFYSPNGPLQEAVIIAAPSNFPHELPYDAGSYITANGVLFMPNLPMGVYAVQGTDSCDFTQTIAVEVKGDIYNQSPFITINKYCNVFDVIIDNDDYRPAPLSPSESFWLQYLNETTGQWENPYTGVPYPSGTIPTTDNSLPILLSPNADVYEILNMGLFGTYRIVKVYTVVVSDSPYQTEQCLKESYYQFEYSMDLTITNAYRIICEEGDKNLQNVFIQAEGIPPLSYYIVQKDGQPFFVDNGTNNVFTDLEPGIYTFQVTDPCGNIRNRNFDLADIELMVANGPTPDVPACTDPETNTYEIYLPDRNVYLVASTLSLDYFTFSYHNTYDEAYNDVNPLANTYYATPGIHRIYVRIENNLIEGCFNIAYFDLIAVESPRLSKVQTEYFLCEDQESVLIDISGLFDNYLWYDNSTNSSIEVSEGGTYTVTVSNQIRNVICEEDITFTVDASSAPIIEEIVVDDWTYTNNSITVHVSGSGNYVYSLNGVFYQQSNVFTGLQTGYYTIFVKDVNGCGETTSEALVLNYPRYFTPNGDGIHDYWRIPLSSYEPDMIINIFDRYGKLITSFKGNEMGWDGTFNGKKLHSTDYWFTVERKNGVIKRGHFSMKR